MNWLKTYWQYIVPVLGFLGAVFIYVAHDRRLKILQIKQLKEEQDKKKQAEIKCNTYTHKANSVVRIVNAGPADAFNVRVEILNKDEIEGVIFYHDNWGTYDLINATNSVEERLALCSGHTEYLKLKVTWDDAYAQNRSIIINSQI